MSANARTVLSRFHYSPHNDKNLTVQVSIFIILLVNSKLIYTENQPQTAHDAKYEKYMYD